MMVLNPQRITENDNMILLQNEDWFLSWGYLKGKFHHYKMTIGFYHQVTWRGHSATTKWRLVFMCFYHQVTWRENFNTTKWRLVFIIKLLEGDTPPLQNEDGSLYAFIIRLLEGKNSMLQNEIGFLHVVFRWANSLATKWFSIFKGLFQLPKCWKRIKCNSQALCTKCLAHPIFSS